MTDYKSLSIEELSDLYLNGDIEASFYLGQKYLKVKDKEKALEAFLFAGKKGYEEAYLYIGRLYLEKGDITNALSWLEDAADNKDSKALTLLGDIYSNKDNEVFSLSEAIKYYSKASLLNNNDSSKAEYRLGEIYLDKNNLSYSFNKALDWLNKAYGHGNIEAANKLGTIYLERNEVDKALEYFLYAAKKGDEVAQYNVGALYLNKDNAFFNLDEGLAWLKESSDQDYIDATYYLGKYYSLATKKYNPQLAISLLSKVRNLKEEKYLADTCYTLATLYTREDNPSFSISKALSYYKEAEALGEINAMYALGDYYEDNDNLDIAITYYKKASDNGNILASHRLGVIFSNKDNDEYNLELAEKYYSLAASKKYSHSLYNLCLLYIDRDSELYNAEKANKLLDQLKEVDEKYYQEVTGFYNEENDPSKDMILSDEGVVEENKEEPPSEDKDEEIYLEACDKIDNDALDKIDAVKTLHTLANKGHYNSIKKLIEYYEENNDNENLYEVLTLGADKYQYLTFMMNLAEFLVKTKGYKDEYKRGMDLLLECLDESNKDWSKRDEALVRMGECYDPDFDDIYLKEEKDIDKAIEYYIEAAELNNNFDAIKYLIYTYIDKGDAENQYKWLAYGANKAHYLKYMSDLGIFLCSKNGFKEDFEAGYKYLMDAAKDDNAFAYNLKCVGNLYDPNKNDKDLGVGHKDAEKAIEFYLEALDKEDDVKTAMDLYNLVGEPNFDNYLPEIGFRCLKLICNKSNNDFYQFSLAQYYDKDFKEYGLPTLKNDEEMLRWYKLAADNSNIDAAYNYALEMKEANNILEAIKYFSKAGEYDNKALHQLAIIHDPEIGVDGYKDIYKAIDYYKKATDKGNYKSKFYLAITYDDPASKEVYNRDKAIQLYEELAEEKDEKNNQRQSAAFNLALIYANKNDKYYDLGEAIHYYRIASELNHPKAAYNLASIYNDDSLICYNVKKAIDYYKIAADNGHDLAALSLLFIYKDPNYENGKYFNVSEAIKYGRISAELGNVEAKSELGQLLITLCDEQFYKTGVYQQDLYDEAIKWLSEASEKNDYTALAYLGRIYEKGFGVEINLNKAKDYYQRSYDNGNADIADDISRVINLLSEEEAKSFGIAKEIDMFISWQHDDLELKEKVVKTLASKNIQTFDSDNDATGVLDEKIKNAIYRSKSYVVLLTENTFKSGYIPKEISWMMERISKDELSKDLIKVFLYPEDFKDKYKESFAKLAKDSPFNKLLDLTFDFSCDINKIVEHGNKMKKNFAIFEYQKRMKEEFKTFSIFISETKNTSDTSKVINTLEYDKGYVPRTLINDVTNVKYNELDVVSKHNYVLIHGEGGLGKSMYLKNLIRLFSKEQRVFFYLPCINLKEIITNNNDLLSIVYETSFKNQNNSLSLEDIKGIFRNDYYEFYFVFDALDESGSHKNQIIELVKNFVAPNMNKVHFIFTSRSKMDADLISRSVSKEVTSLTLSKMNDDDIIDLFDNVYRRNINTIDKGHNINSINDNVDKSKNSTASSLDLEKEDQSVYISKDVFKDKLAYISEEIKGNPLYISSLIYIYFAKKQLNTQKFFILEAVNEINMNTLRKESGNINSERNIIDKLDISLNDLLEYLAFNINKDYSSNPDIITIINDYLEEQGIEGNNERNAKEIASYLRNKKVIVNNNFSHGIFSSYYAASYIFKKVYKFAKDDSVEETKYLTYKNADKLEQYIDAYFDEDIALWAPITIDFISKLDYEIYRIPRKQAFSRNDKSFAVFDSSMNKLLASTGINEKSYNHIKMMIEEEKNLLYLESFIKAYLKR